MQKSMMLTAFTVLYPADAEPQALVAAPGYAALLADLRAPGVVRFTGLNLRFLTAVMAYRQFNHLVKVGSRAYLKFSHSVPTNPMTVSIKA
jgi:hypothetical protein